MITQWHIDTLDAHITALQERIAELERENIETTNALYEMENRLQAQLDAIITYTMFEPNDVM